MRQEEERLADQVQKNRRFARNHKSQPGPLLASNESESKGLQARTQLCGEANDRAATPRRVSFKRLDAFFEPATPKATSDQAKVAPEEPNPKKRGVVEEPVPESRPCKTPRCHFE